ncbi:MAG: phage scaffolding protein [Ruminococcus sp.]|nr:phage scaffolding protein [Ruminococcus sp.]
MKTEDLQAKGLTDEQITFVMAENGKDVKREKDRADGYKSQLDTAKESLKSFEGVDVAKLQSEITRLNNDLANKDAEHAKALADRDFNDMISKYAAEYKAHDVKAVLPFLDAEKLKASKNQEADVKAAFEAVKKEKAYLFADTKVPRVISSTPGADPKTDAPKTQANEALRSLFGHNA